MRNKFFCAIFFNCCYTLHLGPSGTLKLVKKEAAKKEKKEVEKKEKPKKVEKKEVKPKAEKVQSYFIVNTILDLFDLDYD